MGVEAARLALRAAPDAGARRAVVRHRRARRTSTRPTPPRSTPRCASTRDVAAFDLGGAVRSGVGALRAALDGNGTALVVAADLRTGLPGERRRGGRRRRRRRAARRRRRRRPGDRRVPRRGAAPPRSSSTAGARRATAARRCGRSASARSKYVPLGEQAWNARAEGGRARRRPGRPRRSSPGMHAACGDARSRAGSASRTTRSSTTSPRRSATPAPRTRRCCSPTRSRRPSPARSIALVVLADGADVLLFRTTDALAVVHAGAPVADADRARRADRLRQVPRVARHASRSSRRAGPSRRASRRRRPAAPRTGSSASSARATATTGALHLPPRACRASATRSTTWSRRRWPTSQGTIVDVHHRPARVLAEPADRVRGRRLRRRRPPPGRAHRRRRRRASQIGDRVEMTFRRLFTADGIHNYFWKARPVRDDSRGDTHGLARHQGPVAIVGMGCTPFGEHWDKGPDDLLIDAAERGVRVGRHRQGRRRRVLARHRAGGHERHHAGPPAAARGQAGHPRRELLRDRVRGAAPGGVRGRVRRVRHRDGDRRREGEGLRLPGAQRVPDARTTAPAARSPRRRCSRWSRPRTRKKYGVDDDEMREVLARIAWKNHYNGARNPRAQFRREMSHGDDLRRRRWWPAALGVFDCAGVADGSAAAIVVRAEDAARSTPTSRST